VIAGRGEEQLAITTLLDGAVAGRGAALSLVGEPGIGKSTLLDWACETADDRFTVVRTVGVQTDVAIPYAGLLDLAAPVRAALAEVPPGQRAALEGALGWGEPVEGTLLLVSAATVSLLAAAAGQRPVLVVVDDLQWLDPQTRRVVEFAVPRLGHDPVAFLMARRQDVPAATAPTGRPDSAGSVEERLVPALPAGAAAELLPELSPVVRDRLHEVTGGNPLAMVEAASRLTPAQRRGSSTLPETVVLGERLLDGFSAAVAGLSAPARRAVTLVAAAPRLGTGPLVDVLTSEGLDAEAALDEVLAAGLVRVEATTSFTHPLRRAAAWGSATPAERRWAHRALAASPGLDPDVRLQHRVAATSGFDDELSRVVQDSWHRRRRRLGFASSADLLEQAARLSSSPARAALLLARAAEDALAAGDLERVRLLADQVLDRAPPAEARARVSYVLGVVEEYAGSVPRARSLLEESAAAATGLTRVRALAELGTVAYRLGDPPALESAAERLHEAADHDDAEQRMLACYVRSAAAAFSGRWDDAREPAATALELLETDPELRDDPRHLVVAMTAAVWMGDPTTALAFVDRRERQARDSGAVGLLPFALTLLAGGAIVLGQHLRGYAYADEAVRLGTDLGYVVDVSTGLELLAVQLAARGRHDEATTALARSRDLAVVAGVAEASVQVELVTAFAALCRGDVQVAADVLEERLRADGGRLPNGDYELSVAPDLVEALLALGRADEAAALARRHRDLHLDSALPLARARARRLIGMTDPDPDRSYAAFEQAVAEHSGWPDAYEAARTRLAYGSRLRRDGQRRLAREHLQAARDTFHDLGFSAWVDRADGELHASGRTARRSAGRDEALTAQEARVGLLVATGMTNKEIAAALFLSPKTVEHHVTAALRKTGVRTRTELAVALSSAGPDGGAGAAPGATVQA